MEDGKEEKTQTLEKLEKRLRKGIMPMETLLYGDLNELLYNYFFFPEWKEYLDEKNILEFLINKYDVPHEPQDFPELYELIAGKIPDEKEISLMKEIKVSTPRYDDIVELLLYSEFYEDIEEKDFDITFEVIKKVIDSQEEDALEKVDMIFDEMNHFIKIDEFELYLLLYIIGRTGTPYMLFLDSLQDVYERYGIDVQSEWGLSILGAAVSGNMEFIKDMYEDYLAEEYFDNPYFRKVTLQARVLAEKYKQNEAQDYIFNMMVKALKKEEEK